MIFAGLLLITAFLVFYKPKSEKCCGMPMA
jgi:hypothetical protein